MARRTKILAFLSALAMAVLLSACAAAPASDDSPFPDNLIRLPVVRQGTGYTCGVACVQSILYYNGIDFREDDLAAALGSTPENGTNIDQIISFLTQVTWEDGWWLGLGTEFSDGIGAERQDGMTVEELCAAIDQGHPVICCIQAWYGESGYDYTDEWECGHYVVAIGYDDANVYFMDPSTLGNYTYIEKEEFMTRWHDSANGEVCNQLGIIITNPNPVFSPEQIMPLE